MVFGKNTVNELFGVLTQAGYDMSPLVREFGLKLTKTGRINMSNAYRKRLEAFRDFLAESLKMLILELIANKYELSEESIEFLDAAIEYWFDDMRDFKFIMELAEYEAEREEEEKGYWTGVARVLISREIVARKFGVSAGIENEEDLNEWVENTFGAGAGLLDYTVDGHVVKVDDLGDDGWDDDVLMEGLYENDENNCVDKFVEMYKLNGEGYKNGMPLSDFLEKATEDGFEVYNNDLIKLNNVVSDKKVCAYGGHILSYFPVARINTNKYVEADEFVRMWQTVRANKENWISNIVVYDGCYGRWVRSFVYDGVNYKRSFVNPSELVRNVLKDYACSFYHPMSNNATVCNGKIRNANGYDLNRAYVNALDRVKRIPIIDNIPMTWWKAKHLSEKHFVCLCEEFVRGGVTFPSCFWYAEDVVKYGLHPIEVYLVKEFKEFDSSIIYKALEEYVEPENDELLVYKSDLPKREVVNGRNKWNEAVIKRALGSLLTGRVISYASVMSYLDDIMNTELDHVVAYEPDDVSYRTKFLHNVHFAMSSEYHHMLLDFMEKYPVQAIKTDCLFVSKDVEVESNENWKFEKYVEKDELKYCYRTYKSKMHLITGAAGTGKTTYLKEKIPPEYAIVIVPERRLSTVWDQYETQTLQYITARHRMLNKLFVIIDEVYKFATEDLSTMLGYLRYLDVEVYMAGDAYQFEQIRGHDRFYRRVYAMNPELVLKENHRNNFDYKAMNLLEQKDKNVLKELFDKYLANFMVDENDEDVFDDINYCYLTQADDSTQHKYDQLYQAYVKKVNAEVVYARCIRNVIIGGKHYYNGVIYRMPAKGLPHAFVISNTYSIYATQGQSMKKIRLIRDDEKYYYENWRMLYVLISRITVESPSIEDIPDNQL